MNKQQIPHIKFCNSLKSKGRRRYGNASEIIYVKPETSVLQIGLINLLDLIIWAVLEKWISQTHSVTHLTTHPTQSYSPHEGTQAGLTAMINTFTSQRHNWPLFVLQKKKKVSSPNPLRRTTSGRKTKWKLGKKEREWCPTGQICSVGARFIISTARLWPASSRRRADSPGFAHHCIHHLVPLPWRWSMWGNLWPAGGRGDVPSYIGITIYMYINIY